MHMLYNSDNFAVVQFDVPAPTGMERLTRGGFEIVDKFSRREIFIEGALAESFKDGVEQLISQSPSEDDIDDFVSGFAAMAQQPVLLH
ncbi:uncharacterized protein DUF3567 [Sphaerotilus hippei]|uniref:Uncharacterized protein DUF3567 n=1 Tax=Sphaerotilus hippei TaxID=744406 RepID=A0A318GWD5_9BURK|nr:DUF3567 domain-containing protein [Sphaerotilus hippei]PXW93645.1 uncharacterized protein DUF3567 [Sphaerotilus hippei]